MKIRKITITITLLLVSVCIYGQKSIDDFNIIGDSTKMFKTIDDIIKIEALKNKVAYIDVWGTRCGPCLMEFKYLPDLKNKFRNDSIVFLYLCSPYSMTWNNENAELWKKLIIKHNLDGINIFMSAECYIYGLYEKYKEKFTPSTMYMIPRYL